MLEIARGQTSNPSVAERLIELLTNSNLSGSLYIGFPVLATADESITVDALLVTRNHGLVAFLFDEFTGEHEEELDRQELRKQRLDQLYVVLESNLSRHQALRDGRKLAIDVNTLMITTELNRAQIEGDDELVEIGGVLEAVEQFPQIRNQYWKPLQAALQRVATLRPPKKRNLVQSASSKGAVIKKIEQEIANLDRWQKMAAIENPSGPQRIRGLAGSGKTVVLALKAAYLHAQHPDWRIAVTFWSRALYQQFEDMVRRFTFAQINDEPDWDRLQILHAWGGANRDGIYLKFAEKCGVLPRNYVYGRSKYGMDDAFRGVCTELLDAITDSTPEPIYEAVLIDEAQDLPPPFFGLVYKFTKQPKRIVWAYDELQKLSESALPTVTELFGTNRDGSPVVNLVNSEDSPKRDIVLPVCYRNTPWALTLAHGLGLGTAREEGLVQSFDEIGLWNAIGYKAVGGELLEGRDVVLRRRENSYPGYFDELLDQQDAVQIHVYESAEDQARGVAAQIKADLTSGELEHDDILVVYPDVYRAKSSAELLSDALKREGIRSHVPGVTSTRDALFKPGSVALANIYRSKGNEAPMVYVMNSQFCAEGRELTTARNILFTAITRSKGWVRICGWGSDMEVIESEANSIRDEGFQLRFRVPTETELSRIRRIHRELSASEKKDRDRAERGLSDFIETMERGDLSIDEIPPRLRTALARIIAELQIDADED
ncbi:MAG: ATP-binding domain-containing protein [Chloroflexota bacterium]|nr:ATP-binding domain-containing protein [Chloroflexota bacterium]